jgi:hypothetical protein
VGIQEVVVSTGGGQGSASASGASGLTGQQCINGIGKIREENLSLKDYIKIICVILDIPVHNDSLTDSLHVLFSKELKGIPVHNDSLTDSLHVLFSKGIINFIVSFTNYHIVVLLQMKFIDQ